jgi:hypothetical protein
MNEHADAMIDADAIAVVVEMGDDFTPGSRTAAALAELAEALHDEHGPETSGFAFDAPAEIRNFAFYGPGDSPTVAGLKWNDITLKFKGG